MSGRPVALSEFSVDEEGDAQSGDHGDVRPVIDYGRQRREDADFAGGGAGFSLAGDVGFQTPCAGGGDVEGDGVEGFVCRFGVGGDGGEAQDVAAGLFLFQVEEDGGVHDGRVVASLDHNAEVVEAGPDGFGFAEESDVEVAGGFVEEDGAAVGPG